MGVRKAVNEEGSHLLLNQEGKTAEGSIRERTENGKKKRITKRERKRRYG